MPFPFACPHCGHKTSVLDESGRLSNPCVECGKTMPPVPTYAPPPKEKSNWGRWFIAVLVGGGLVTAILLPAIEAERASRGPHCSNSLKQIALAMHNYYDTYGSFPPAVVSDEDGQPLYSWRVLILPFIEERALYDAFQLDEPWNSPANLPITHTKVRGFQCPNEEPLPGMTDYVMVVGPNTISDGASTTQFEDITDGAANTILIAEAAGSGIYWSEPRDLYVMEMGFRINGPGNQEMQSSHPGGVNVAMVDGSVRFLSDDTDPALLRNLTTINDGNVAPLD